MDSMKFMELVHNAMKDLLTRKKYNNKEELMAEATKEVELAKKANNHDAELVYTEAYEKLDNLTWKECKLFIEIIKDAEKASKEDEKGMN